MVESPTGVKDTVDYNFKLATAIMQSLGNCTVQIGQKRVLSTADPCTLRTGARVAGHLPIYRSRRCDLAMMLFRSPNSPPLLTTISC